MAIEALDVLYMPSRDVEADVACYRDVLGGRVIFAIEAIGTRAAEITLAPQGPRVLLADHLPGDAPISCTECDLDRTLAELGARGLQLQARVDCRSARTRPSAARGDSASGSTSARDPKSTIISPAVPTSADPTSSSHPGRRSSRARRADRHHGVHRCTRSSRIRLRSLDRGSGATRAQARACAASGCHALVASVRDRLTRPRSRGVSRARIAIVAARPRGATAGPSRRPASRAVCSRVRP